MSLMQEFPFRHIGPNDEQVNVMLDELALETVEDLINRAVPSNIRERSTEIRLPDALSETGAISRLREIAAKNTVLTSLIGMGYYNSYTPSVIQRNILENPSWYTAYTPYQSEISQGRLEALLNYQAMISDLPGCDIANASLLDEATAAAEARAGALSGRQV